MERKLFSMALLGAAGNAALMNSDSLSDSAKVGVASSTSGGVSGTAAGMGVLEKMADGQSRGVNINRYTKEGAANLASGDSVMSVTKSLLGSALKASSDDALEVPRLMGSSIMTGGGAAGGTILAKKAGFKGGGLMAGSMIGSMVPLLVFSEKLDNMIDSIMNKNFTVSEDLEDGAKSVGNAAGGIVGGGVGAATGALVGAGAGAMAGGAWQNSLVNSALKEANQLLGTINTAKVGSKEYNNALTRMTELSTRAPGKNYRGVFNQKDWHLPGKPSDIKSGGAYTNLSKKQYYDVKAAAKSRAGIGRGKGALIGMGIGTVVGGMQGQEKGSSLFSQVEENNSSVMQKEFGVGREAVNFAKTTGKYLWEKRKPIAKQAVIWGGAGMAGTYVADKLITHDAKKIGLMPSNNNLNQKLFAVINGSVLKNVGGKAWKYTGGLVMENKKEALIAAGSMGALGSLPYLSQRGQFMANKRAAAQLQQQKEFGAVGGVLRKGGGLAWGGLKWAGNMVKSLVWDPKRGTLISKDFQRIGKENNSLWAQKAGNWVENHKLATGVGGAAATLASFEFMRPGEKVTKSILNKADKNAFEYEKQQNLEVQ